MEEQNANYTPPVYPADKPIAEKPIKTIPTFIGIAIVVLVAIVLFGGVFVYQHFSVKTQPVVQTQQTQNNQIAGWKTYANTQYGIGFQYPNYLSAPEISKANSYQNIIGLDNNMIQFIVGTYYDKQLGRVWSFDETVDQRINDKAIHISLTHKNILVDGKDAVEINEERGASNGFDIFIVVKSIDSNADTLVIHEFNKSEDAMLLPKILPTIKFTK